MAPTGSVARATAGLSVHEPVPLALHRQIHATQDLAKLLGDSHERGDAGQTM